jgi:HEAT repeat protein
VALVENALSDESQLVRQTAASTLGDMKARTSIPKLRDALDDDSAAVSFAAAQALWQMGDDSGLSILIQVLEGERGVAPSFIHAKWHDIRKKMRDPKYLAEFGALQAAGAFLGPAGFGVGLVEEIAKDKSSGARALAAAMLARNSESGSRIALENALQDKSWLVRASAAQAMGTRGNSASIDLLAPLLEDSNAEVRYNAAAAVMRLSPRVTVPGPADGSAAPAPKGASATTAPKRANPDRELPKAATPAQ